MANESIETEINLNEVGKTNETIQNMDRPLRSPNAADEIEIEIVDDTPEGDRDRKPPAAGTKTAVPSDEEIEQYKGTVQDRLKQMKWEYHEERRAKERALREQAAAVDMTQKVYNENQQLRKMLESGHKTMLDANKASGESEIAALRESLKSAHDAGDSSKIAELQEKLSRAAARLVNAEQTQPIKFDDPDTSAGQRPQPNAQQLQPPQLTNAMQGWMDENQWFNGRGPVERRMTAYAFGVHDSLKEEGVPLESPAYFKRINDEMKERFPEYYGKDDAKNDAGNGSQSQRRTVGSVNRLNGTNAQASNGPKTKVTLTESEIRLADKMRIPRAEYAKEKLRLENNANG